MLILRLLLESSTNMSRVSCAEHAGEEPGQLPPAFAAKPNS